MYFWHVKSQNTFAVSNKALITRFRSQENLLFFKNIRPFVYWNVEHVWRKKLPFRINFQNTNAVFFKATVYLSKLKFSVHNVRIRGRNWMVRNIEYLSPLKVWIKSGVLWPGSPHFSIDFWIQFSKWICIRSCGIVRV